MKVANFLVFFVILITLYGLYVLLIDTTDKPEVFVVFWSSWITCAATGIGVIPFTFIKDFEKKWIAYGNAIAAGMMMSAAMGLIDEGLHDSDNSVNTVLFGFFFGLFFIWQSKKVMDSSNAFDQLNSFEKIEFKKFVLVMGVMTLHSLSEGIGIGVSYHSHSLGSFISATLAVHNIPEGLAIAMVTLPSGRFSKRETFLWCVFSSLPQPIMAVPSFLFVEAFRPMFSIGLGFAAGAMLYVAILELLVEASEELSANRALTVVSVSATVMAMIQVLIRTEM